MNPDAPFRAAAVATVWPVLIVAGLAALAPALTHSERLYTLLQPCIDWTCVDHGGRTLVNATTHSAVLGHLILGPVSLALPIAGGEPAVIPALVGTALISGMLNVAILFPLSEVPRALSIIVALSLWVLVGFANSVMGT